MICDVSSLKFQQAKAIIKGAIAFFCIFSLRPLVTKFSLTSGFPGELNTDLLVFIRQDIKEVHCIWSFTIMHGLSSTYGGSAQKNSAFFHVRGFVNQRKQ